MSEHVKNVFNSEGELVASGNQSEIILRVTDLGASLQYGKLKVTAEPLGDMFYVIELDPEHCQTREDGTKVFTKDGIRHVMKGLLSTLLIDSDKESF